MWTTKGETHLTYKPSRIGPFFKLSPPILIAIVTIMSMVAVAVPMLVVVASNGDGCVSGNDDIGVNGESSNDNDNVNDSNASNNIFLTTW